MSTTNKVKLIITGGLLILAISILWSTRALPNSEELYDLKRLQEKIFLRLKTNSNDKINYYNMLLDERLNELVSLIENRQFDYILTSSLRYSTTAGLLTEMIINRQMNDSIPAVQKKFKKHQKIIKELDDSYPKDENEEWKFIQDDYNYLTIYSQQLADAAVK